MVAKKDVTTNFIHTQGYMSRIEDPPVRSVGIKGDDFLSTKY